EQSFLALKDLLASNPVVTHPDPRRPFELAVDAWPRAISGNLYQRDYSGHHRVCYYGSWKLSRTEQNYSQPERECLAVVRACRDDRPYLLHNSFILWTDCTAIVDLIKKPDLSGKFARWVMFLADFPFDCRQRSAARHRDADALSRLHPVDEQEGERLQDVGLLDDGVEDNEGAVVDAFSIDWSAENAWANPPFETDTLLIPAWTTAPWFPAVLRQAMDTPVALPCDFDLFLPGYTDNRIAVGSPRWPVLAVRISAARTPSDLDPPIAISPLLNAADSNLVSIGQALDQEKPSTLPPRLRRRLSQFLLVGGLLHKRTPDWPPRRVVLGCDERKKTAILEELHDRQGHYGSGSSLIRVRARYFWLGIEEDVRSYVQSCDVCQRRGKPRDEDPPSEGSSSLPGFFEVWHLDSSGALSPSAGFHYFQIAVERFSGWVVVHRTRSKPTEETSYTLAQRVVREHGVPIQMFSRTAAYNPRANGAAERSVQEVSRVLSRLMLDRGADWGQVFDDAI
ncbi:MAG: hypothetical protein BJ554DRAFT_2207, partial [Olpidium bornovanus]